MTALCFAHLDAADRVAVKPHASPVFHAIQYLLGDLDRSYLSRLRAARRPAVLPLAHQGPRPRRLLHRLGGSGRGRAAVRRRHPALRRRPLRRRGRARASSRCSATPSSTRATSGRPSPTTPPQGLGNVDVDRRLQPPVARPGRCPASGSSSGRRSSARPAGTSSRSSTAAGCRRRSHEPGGDALRDVDRRDAQRAVPVAVRADAAPALRARFLDGAPEAVRAGASTPSPTRSSRRWSRPRRPRPRGDARARYARVRRRHRPAERGLRLHDQGLGPADRGQPAQPLRAAQRRPGRRAAGAARGSRPTPSGTASTPTSPAGVLVHARGASTSSARRARAGLGGRGARAPPGSRSGKPIVHPGGLRPGPRRPVARRAVAPYLVTTAPDVATSTNLAGFINRTGVYSPDESAPGTRTRC